MRIQVQHRYSGLVVHEVKGVCSYGSGDLFVVLDTPWQDPSDPLSDPTAVVAVRQVNARWANPSYSCWREVWGDVRAVALWLETAEEGETVKLKGRKFTKLSPSILPRFIEVPTPSDCAAL